MDIRLVLGLGNPGIDYVGTRHNIGFMALDAFARSKGLSWIAKNRYTALLSEWIENGTKRFLFKPETYMNRSGEALARFLKDHPISPDQILVVHDELDVPLGRVKAVFDRGPAGHNGVRSVIEHLGTSAFYRIRIGIGKPKSLDHIKEQEAGRDFVLGAFRGHEKKQVDDVLSHVVEAIGACFDQPWDMIMRTLHQLHPSE